MFGVTCAAPVAQFFNTKTTRDQLAAVTAVAPKFGGASGPLASKLSTWRTSGGLFGLNSVASPWGVNLRPEGFGLRYSPINLALANGLLDPAVRPARESVEATAPEALSAAAAAAPLVFSGETISLSIGTLPAGKSITIKFQATISNSINSAFVSNQGTVSGSNFAPVVTDDPATGALGDPTVTPVGTPPTISCPADISVNTDPGQFSASVSFNVSSTGTPAPTVDCKIGATSITSPHTFPVGTTAVQCTATNGVGSPATCSFNVTVTDNQTPTISCPANITANADANSCSANVNAGTPSVNDNDPNVVTSGVRSDSQPLNAPYPLGTTTITWTATDTAGNSASCQQTITVVDTTAPVITLNGPASLTVECHTSFTDPGATASDNCGGSVPVTVTGTVNPDAPGVYMLTYTASDAAGNNATPVVRSVTVSDTTPPVVTLNGAADVTVECHTSFSDPGATATDSCAGPLPVSTSGSVNVNAPGDYTLTYSATDPAGNTGTATRSVHVRDTTAPVIALNGANPMTVECHTTFTDPGATATDACDTSVPVSVSGSVNSNVPGTYTLTYNASDDSGNNATPVTRTVNVVDTTPPVVTLNGAADVTVECHTSFSDPGASASDSCGGPTPVSTSGSVNVNVPGDYTLTYSATDASGNTGTATRAVHVRDTIAPVITLNGASSMTVECHTSFSDPGATATDACDTSVPVTVSGSVNVNSPGTYTLTYNASDDSGNAASPKTRTVTVVDTIKPVITVNSLAPSLWPANHKYVSFNVTDFVTGVTDGCSTTLGISSVVVEKITSDETENGNGDGNTTQDIVIAANCKSFQVRAERDGGGDGRVYTVTLAVKDSSGNIGRKTVKIVVPHNPGETPVDSGPHYTVNGSCGP